ncbi:hypothetical protein V1477_003331 [Vespula maculifrons]|uniref:Uncharacterized protein n=1 Tax=Vespula maculifrons TaxID=7453 RepID=A0ABD2CU78_VESMC
MKAENVNLACKSSAEISRNIRHRQITSLRMKPQCMYSKKKCEHSKEHIRKQKFYNLVNLGSVTNILPKITKFFVQKNEESSIVEKQLWDSIQLLLFDTKAEIVWFRIYEWKELVGVFHALRVKKSDEVINITNNEGDTKLREDKRLFVIAVGLSTACFTIDEIKTEWRIHAIQMKYVVFPLIMDDPYIKVAYIAFKGTYVAYSLGNFLLLLRIVPNNVLCFANNFVAVNGSTSLRTTNSTSDIDDSRIFSFFKYDEYKKKLFIIYLLLASDINQNVMTNLSGLLILRKNVRILYLQTSIKKLTGYQCGYVTSVRILTIDLIIDGIKAKIRIHTIQEEIVIKLVDSIIFSKKNAKRNLIVGSFQQVDYNTGRFDTNKLSTTSSIPLGMATTAGINVINIIIDENKHHNNSSIL